MTTVRRGEQDVSSEKRAIERLTKAITLMLDGSLCDARDIVSDVAFRESTSLRTVMDRMLELIDRLTDEFSSKESALALVQTATWELEETRDNLRKNEERYRNLVETTNDWIWEVDADCVYTFTSPQVRTILGFGPDEVVGRTPFDFMASREVQRVGEIFGRTLAARAPILSLETANVHKEGREVVLEMSAVPFFSPDGVLLGYRGIDRDITARKQLEEKIHQLAYHDSLTGLPNRQLLSDRFHQAIARARHSKQHVCLAMLDLDHFKDVNDTLGHEAGDALLREVSQRLVRTLQEGDTVARMGGDEFMLVLGELAESHLELVASTAQRVLDSIREPVAIGDRQVCVSGSIGIAVFPGDGEDLETLVRHADTAMYQTKHNSRDGYCFFDHKIAEMASSAFELETSLHGALDRNEFVLHYQPIIDIVTGSINGVEALIRWKPSNGELVAADLFITLAEKTKLIVPIGRWVLQEACRQAASWMASTGKRVAVAVNISARQLQHPDIVETVIEAIRHADLDPSLLQLELTESTMMHDFEEAKRTLLRLRDHGVLITVDSFGTGHSSLQRLRSLPIDVLKLDRTFVRNVTSDPADAIMVAAVVAMAHELGLRVVAEGVETQDQLECLRAPRWRPTHGHKCDLVQGYFFSRPVPAADIARMIERADPIGPLYA